MSNIERVGVVGCGLMGSGIAEVCARSGVDVTVIEADETALENGRTRIAASLARAEKSGKIEEGAAKTALDRLSYATDLSRLSNCQIVFEAVAEIEAVKLEVFRELDRIIGDNEAVLASNTSSIPIITLAMATAHPERVVGAHFFNPVPVLDLVEIIPSLRTAPSVVERVETFVSTQLKKLPLHAPDRAGFIVNALLIPFLLSAVRMYEAGIASAQDIDRGLEAGCAHPIGPLRLSDLIGLDTLKAIADVLYEEYKEPLYASPPLLSRMVSGGLLGRKTGQGFYNYDRK